ncbi:MAG: hypothetical protein R2827_00410 [Bdellovibrionales bacterium]
MKSLKFLVIGMGIIFSSLVMADTHGVGIILGKPTGITYKYLHSNAIEYDGHLGLTSGNADIHARRLHVKNKFYSVKSQIKNTNWYWGYGLSLHQRKINKNDSEVRQTLIGAQAPLGIRYLFQNPTVEGFAEVSGTLYVAPDSFLDFSGVIGLRFFFD